MPVSEESFRALIARYSNWGKWGAADERGTLNFITGESLTRAAAEIRTGAGISLAIPFDSAGPQNGAFGRFNPIHLMARDGGDALSGAVLEVYGHDKDRQFRGTDDIIIMPLQCGTQWDALAHVIHEGKIYNGRAAETVSSFGAKFGSIDKMSGHLVGRGVLYDLPRLNGISHLEAGQAIMSADLERAEDATGTRALPGDIVLIRTGHMAHCRGQSGWGSYAGGAAPGLGLDSLRWIAERRIAAVATDTFAVEVQPNETLDIFQPFHIIAIVYMGMPLGEIFFLDRLAESCAVAGRYTFMLAAQPLPFTGAVGSPVNPIAIL